MLSEYAPMGSIVAHSSTSKRNILYFLKVGLSMQMPTY